MRSEDSFFELLKINITSRFYNIKDYVRTFFLYWRDFSFLKIDLYLVMSYFFKSPYRIAREDDNEPYGETPLHTMEKIAKAANISKDDVVYELGCGRGRTCFWLHHFISCKTVGIDHNSTFCVIAERTRNKYIPNDDNLIFICDDMRRISLEEASCVYLYGTVLPDEFIRTMVEQFKKVKTGSRIITISFSLDDYDGKSYFKLLEELEVEFPWGKTSAYIHKRI